MFLAQEPCQVVDMVAQFLLVTGPGGLEEWKPMPQVFGLLPPLVEVLHTRFGTGSGQGAITCLVHALQAAAEG